MKRIWVCFIWVMLLVISSCIPPAQAEDSPEYICEDVTQYAICYNKYILSKEINSVENPRKWHNVIEKNEFKYFLLSSNPDIDHEKLNNVYNKLKEKLTEDYEIAIMNSDNVEYDKIKNKEYEKFYIVIQSKNDDFFTLKYNGAIMRIKKQIGDLTWSELMEEVPRITDEEWEILTILSDTVIELIDEDAKEKGDNLEKLCYFYQIGKLRKKNSGKKVRIRDIYTEGTEGEWYERSFPHLQKNITNYFVKRKGRDIDRTWEGFYSYALYYESKRILLEEFGKLDNKESYSEANLWSKIFYTNEIINLENDVNFFLNAVNAMDYWIRVMGDYAFIKTNGMKFEIDIDIGISLDLSTNVLS